MRCIVLHRQQTVALDLEDDLLGLTLAPGKRDREAAKRFVAEGVDLCVHHYLQLQSAGALLKNLEEQLEEQKEGGRLKSGTAAVPESAIVKRALTESRFAAYRV